jgi:hypothetical protein
VLQERDETNRVYTFLTALDSSYEAIRAQILLSTEKLTFDGVTTLIRQEAIRHVAMGAFDSNLSQKPMPSQQKGGAYPGSMLDFASPSPTKEI